MNRTSPPLRDILVAAAVPGEVAGLQPYLEPANPLRVGGRNLVAGRLGDRTVRLLVTGVGLVNTVQALTAAIEVNRPDLLIQTGCAGAFAAAGLGLGDLALATEEIDVQLGIESPDESGWSEPLPFAVLKAGEQHFRHRYPLNARLVARAAEALETITGDRISRGPFVTVSTVTATDRRALLLSERYRPCMETMEGSGAAFLALHYGLPFLEVRSASNRVGQRDRDTWNLPQAFQRSAEAVRIILEKIDPGWLPTDPPAPGGDCPPSETSREA